MKIRQWIMFIGLGLIWGSSFFWIKIALAEVGPFLLVAVRLGFGVIGMLAGMAIRRPKFPSSRRTWAFIALLGLTNSALPFSLVAWGAQFIDSSVVSILVSSVPVITVILSLFLLKDDPVTADKIVGVGIGFAGVLVLVWRGVQNAGRDGDLGGGCGAGGGAAVRDQRGDRPAGDEGCRPDDPGVRLAGGR